LLVGLNKLLAQLKHFHLRTVNNINSQVKHLHTADQHA